MWNKVALNLDHSTIFYDLLKFKKINGNDMENRRENNIQNEIQQNATTKT